MFRLIQLKFHVLIYCLYTYETCFGLKMLLCIHQNMQDTS